MARLKASGERTPGVRAVAKVVFGRLLRKKAGITDRRKVFHSFRHSFKRMARDAGIPEEMHDALTGHAGGGGVGKSYGRGVSLNPLIDAMDRIPAPATISRLEWSLRANPHWPELRA